jgi:hypothetical protein
MAYNAAAEINNIAWGDEVLEADGGAWVGCVSGRQLTCLKV